jgi:serine/threonine protein kinase
MELVRGVRITQFCDEARLSTEARLRLFVEVCQALQHALQKGIIHRDIKPSNILVTVNDGVPVPKVIDFGIAKAIAQKLTDKTLFTQFQALVGTSAYMSPEQADMSSVDIDTRSDIYSLGVLLYELLTGRPPFDGEQLLSAGLDEMRRTIRDEEPPRPSNRLDTLGIAEATILSGKRRVSVPELAGAVRGDLDWIVMKCLEKDRSRRYETANGLAMDVQRHLNSEPVIARSPSGMYLLQKLAQRNRGALIAAAMVVAALLVAVLTLAMSNARIRQERNLKDHALLQRGAALEAARASERRAREQLFVSLQSQA